MAVQSTSKASRGDADGNSAAAGKHTLIVPDKDVDGLSSGAILRETLILLGLDAAKISTHLLKKGSNVHEHDERVAMAAYDPAYIFVLDQGSRKSPPVIDKPHKALIIDHHDAPGDDFPEGSQQATASNSPPVATSSLLTYLICRPLHGDVQKKCDWLCIMGTHGDLGNALKWKPPFPDMEDTFKRYTKKAINTAVSLINALRRTADDSTMPSTWAALIAAKAPTDLLGNATLTAARAEVRAEIERCTHVAPRFSSDGRVAVLRIRSRAQVHSILATRWANHLCSDGLEVVLVANDGYLPGMVNFSCRVPRTAMARVPPVNIMEVLRGIAAAAPGGTLLERLGESFARGHKEASGGVVPTTEYEEFEDVLALIEVGKKPSLEAWRRRHHGPREDKTLGYWATANKTNRNRSYIETQLLPCDM